MSPTSNRVLKPASGDLYDRQPLRKELEILGAVRVELVLTASYKHLRTPQTVPT
jgi:predicted acyl esterase